MKLLRLTLLMWGFIVLIAAALLVYLRRAPSEFAYLAYSKPSYNGNHVYVVWPDGTHSRQLSHKNQFNHTPMWSPDGTRIAYQALSIDGRNRVMVQRVNTHENLDIAPGDQQDWELEDWSPRGDYLLVNKQALAEPTISITIPMDGGMDGGKTRLLTRTNFSEYRAQWSPDGQWISLETYDLAANRYGLYRVRAEGGEPQEIVAGAWISGARWSPDGEWLILMAKIRDRVGVYLVRPDGSDLTLIRSTETVYIQNNWLSWSPDSQHIIFLISTGALYSVRLDGTDQRQLSVNVASLIGWRDNFLYFIGYDDDVHRIGLEDGRREYLFHLPGAYQLTWSPTVDYPFQAWMLLLGGVIGIGAGVVRLRR